MKFSVLDYAIVIVYLVGSILFGIFKAGKIKNTKDYFLGGKNMSWWVIDAVNLAGGFSENADAQNSNLTEKIHDTDRIIIPTISFVQASTTPIATINNQKRINLNTASLDELMLLPGIGEKKAKDIIEYRTNIQPFSSVSDLLNISGFGEKTIEEFYDQVTVESGG